MSRHVWYRGHKTAILVTGVLPSPASTAGTHRHLLCDSCEHFHSGTESTVLCRSLICSALGDPLPTYLNHIIQRPEGNSAQL